MILNWTQDEFVDLQISLTEDGNPATLKEGEMIQLVSKVRTDEGAILLDVSTGKCDEEGKPCILIDLAELKVKPGKYRFEINLITAEGKTQNIIKNNDGVLNISTKESF